MPESTATVEEMEAIMKRWDAEEAKAKVKNGIKDKKKKEQEAKNPRGFLSEAQRKQLEAIDYGVDDTKKLKDFKPGNLGAPKTRQGGATR